MFDVVLKNKSPASRLLVGSEDPTRYRSAKLLMPERFVAAVLILVIEPATVLKLETFVDVAIVLRSETKSDVASKFKSVTISDVANVFISLTISLVARVLRSLTISLVANVLRSFSNIASGQCINIVLH